MATPLLNDDGTASMATLIMCSHHAFRRDLACFAKALAVIADGDVSHVGAVRDEWARFQAGIHGHHTSEDNGIFPQLRADHPELASAIDELATHHRAIDPLLARCDELFVDLPRQAAAARDAIGALTELLAMHLDAEERSVIPYLRGAKQFPAPANDDMLAMYADGFAWSSGGIASAVLDGVFAMLPSALVDRLPAARARFDERCRNAWGYAHAGQSVTSAG